MYAYILIQQQKYVYSNIPNLFPSKRSTKKLLQLCFDETLDAKQQQPDGKLPVITLIVYQLCRVIYSCIKNRRTSIATYQISFLPNIAILVLVRMGPALYFLQKQFSLYIVHFLQYNQLNININYSYVYKQQNSVYSNIQNLFPCNRSAPLVSLCFDEPHPSSQQLDGELPAIKLIVSQLYIVV